MFRRWRSRCATSPGLYQVYEISGSALQLGITGFLQAFPFVIFGLFAGAVADSFDRKKLLVVTMVAQLIPSLLLGMLDDGRRRASLACVHPRLHRRPGGGFQLACAFRVDPPAWFRAPT